MISSTRFWRSADVEEESRRDAAYIKVSRTVRVGKSKSICVTYAFLTDDKEGELLYRTVPDTARFGLEILWDKILRRVVYIGGLS